MVLSNNRFFDATISVADMLLWRDIKQTLTTMLVLVVIYFNFVAPGYTVVTAVSKLIFAASIFLFIHGKSPKKMYVFAYSPILSLPFTLTIYKYGILFYSIIIDQCASNS